ncbi:hypothetical protein NO976_02554 [Planktothrix agardhii]|jgi:hypothetical protein|uniref:hypothetical protein n=1 Tax=Planktothrix agardhii TaxID=1160 RepID=UPI001A1C4C12|nr:hypothetical protein [Planktothrix agardhii]MBG0746645.1 hypothetical protein [Planktothrix agardhii KL2]CAD5949980.1 hypothetical protein NO976_02554 [Planktothrix agardhii]
MGISNNFIKPSGNIGNIDLTGITGLNTSYRYFKEGYYKFNPNQPAIIIPATENKVNREITINYREDLNPIHSSNCNLYFGNKNQHPKLIKLGGGYLDTSDGGIALFAECSEPIIIEITIRQDTPITYTVGNYSGDDLMIPIQVRLAIGTGSNYVDINSESYDSDTYQYLINLQKLKNSDSGATGWKLFDIYSFYPGRSITFDVDITNLTQYGNIAIQLFDPLAVGEVLFALANDVVNLELNNMGDKFVGNLTRNALYKDVDIATGEIIITPDFSRHIGRFVAQNQNNNNDYDTVIIENYIPNTADPLSGGTFVLTGDF